MEKIVKVGYVEVNVSVYPEHTILNFGIKLFFPVKTRYLARKAAI